MQSDEPAIFLKNLYTYLIELINQKNEFYDTSHNLNDRFSNNINSHDKLNTNYLEYMKNINKNDDIKTSSNIN